jgi:NitT/TauT family transport system ATP-binding protein
MKDMNSITGAEPGVSEHRHAEAIIKATSLNHAYESSTGWSTALRDFNLEIQHGEFVCVLGPSGCGKSSFLRMLAGLMFPLEGSLLVNGRPITGPGLDRAIVFQEAALFPWLTSAQNVGFGLEMAGWSKAAVRERVADVLKIVGLSEAAGRYPYQLSGGMRHRVAIARAWALRDAAVLLMDEPFSAIDAINRVTLQDHLVQTWLTEPRTVVYVTHDIDEAIFLADRIAIMTPSPGSVGAEIRVELDRPRDRTSQAVVRLKQQITGIMHGMDRRI